MSRSVAPPKKKPHRAEPLLKPSDVRAYLLDHASTLAPADVDSLVARAEEVRAKAVHDGRHELFCRQLEVALRLLADHVNDECPQIPYHTISLLAAALFYWLDPIDAIPDFLPAGRSDDALVLELACELAAPGLERYCTFKDIPIASVLATPKRPAHQ